MYARKQVGESGLVNSLEQDESIVGSYTAC